MEATYIQTLQMHNGNCVFKEGQNPVVGSNNYFMNTHILEEFT